MFYFLLQFFFQCVWDSLAVNLHKSWKVSRTADPGIPNLVVAHGRRGKIHYFLFGKYCEVWHQGPDCGFGASKRAGTPHLLNLNRDHAVRHLAPQEVFNNPKYSSFVRHVLPLKMGNEPVGIGVVNAQGHNHDLWARYNEAKLLTAPLASFEVGA